MNDILKHLFEYYKDDLFLSSNVIPWSSPVPSFGNALISKVATLGLNPSNKEFVGLDGNELSENHRRFETLNSLKIKNWSKVKEEHLSIILNACNQYFSNRPYDNWFKKLDFLISGSGHSYYFPYGNACHLDLSPFATMTKWGDLSNNNKKYLFDISIDSLALILNYSNIRILVLNGQAVIDGLTKYSDISLEKVLLSAISLNRMNSDDVTGYGYTGIVNKIGNVKLNQTIKIIGYNHNIQSSYGITKNVQIALRSWISNNINF